MAIEDILASFSDVDFIYPRLIGSSQSFNRAGISLYYYIYPKDSDGLVAGLRLDFFQNVRFTNFKKPDSNPERWPYFDKFVTGWSCSDEEVLDRFESSSALTKKQLEKMAEHWSISVDQFINTVLVAYELLCDADENGWLGSSNWDGGKFIGQLPQPKR